MIQRTERRDVPLLRDQPSTVSVHQQAEVEVAVVEDTTPETEVTAEEEVAAEDTTPETEVTAEEEVVEDTTPETEVTAEEEVETDTTPETGTTAGMSHFTYLLSTL